MISVVFRADGNKKIGIGHIMRCLTLASELKKSGAKITFICQPDSKDLTSLITNQGIEVIYLPNSDSNNNAIETKEILQTIGQPDWLIVDQYDIDYKWEEIVRPTVKNLMIIDDLANRKHDCDILLDQNFYSDGDVRYEKLVPVNCINLLGPSYALLRREFAANKKSSVNAEVKKILISFGGGDIDNFTAKVLNILSAEEYDNLSIDVVMGSASKHKDDIETTCKQHNNMHYHCQIDYMSKLMLDADLFIGAGGGISWERFVIGLPGVITAIADNQIELCNNLAKADLISYVGDDSEFTNQKFKDHFDKACADFAWRKDVMTRGQKLVDGRGVKKVAAYLKSLAIELKPAKEEDSKNIYQWRNDPANRKFSANSNIFTFESHEEWYEKIIKSDSSNLLVAYENQEPLGVVRFDIENEAALISIYLVPERHSKGWGLPLLIAAKKWLKSNKKHVTEINAEVIPANVASMKIFADCGFTQTNENETSVLLTDQIRHYCKVT